MLPSHTHPHDEYIRSFDLSYPKRRSCTYDPGVFKPTKKRSTVIVLFTIGLTVLFSLGLYFILLQYSV